MRRWVVLAPSAGEIGGSSGPDLPGSVGGLGAHGDVVAEGPPAASHAVALVPVTGRVVELSGPRVKRTLLLSVRDGTPPTVVERFEADLAALPSHIAAIRSWTLSRVDAEASPSPWTHCWEQEFADVGGLTGDYLLHPYHWTYVDRWFDPEVPTSIVRPALVHVFRWADGPVLTPPGRE